MKIHNNFSLINHNSFGIEANAEKFVSISTVQELEKIIASNHNEEKVFIGGGSNILITRNIKGLVINLNMKGISSKKINDRFSIPPKLFFRHHLTLSFQFSPEFILTSL